MKKHYSIFSKKPGFIFLFSVFFFLFLICGKTMAIDLVADSFKQVKLGEKAGSDTLQKLTFIPDATNISFFADMSEGSDESDNGSEDPRVDSTLSDVGGDSEEWFKFYKSTCIQNCPPWALIESIRVYVTPELKGKCDEVTIRCYVNGINEERFNMSIPGFLISLGSSFVNNRELDMSVKSEELEKMLENGGDLFLTAKIAVKNPKNFSVTARGVKIVAWVRSPNSIFFPSDILIPAILSNASDEKIKLKFENLKYVFTDTDITLTSLLDDAEFDTHNFYLAKDKSYETQSELMQLFWKTSDFLSKNMEFGQHTMQLKIDYIECDEDGDEIGPATLYVPETPKPFLLLDQNSAADYFPTCFAQIMGTTITDEDIDQEWDLSWQGVFFKNPPDPKIDQTMARASKFFGILKDSVTCTIDWGEDLGPEAPFKMKIKPNQEYQPIEILSHKYLNPGSYTITSTINYSVRKFEALPNIEEIEEWKPVDIKDLSITTKLNIKVLDKTPPVILDDYHVMDNPPYRKMDEPMRTVSQFNITLPFLIQDNTDSTNLKSVKIFYKFLDNWVDKKVDSITLISPENELPKIFEARVTLNMPMQIASKEPFFKKYPFYLEATDMADNKNNGDLDIKDNDNPPNYGANGTGPAGYFIIYDNMPPTLNFSYIDPMSKETIEHTFVSTDIKERIVRVRKLITPKNEVESKEIYSKNIDDKNDYPVKSLNEIRFPIILPDIITIYEDRRLQFNIEAKDYVDNYNVDIEFYVDNILKTKSDKGKLKMPIIFREPGEKIFDIVVKDKKNADSTFNPLKVQIKVIVKKMHLSIHTLESGK